MQYYAKCLSVICYFVIRECRVQLKKMQFFLLPDVMSTQKKIL